MSFREITVLLSLLAITAKRGVDCRVPRDDGRVLFLDLIAAFEPFHPAGGVNYLLLASEERMAFAA